MIDKDDLFVGNQVYTVPHGVAVITKVGRKFTYTDNKNLIIENESLMVKHTGKGLRFCVFESEEDYIKTYKERYYPLGEDEFNEFDNFAHNPDRLLLAKHCLDFLEDLNNESKD